MVVIELLQIFSWVNLNISYLNINVSLVVTPLVDLLSSTKLPQCFEFPVSRSVASFTAYHKFIFAPSILYSVKED